MKKFGVSGDLIRIEDSFPTGWVDVADTVGAGGAFSAAFPYKFCHGKNPFTSAYYGDYLGAYVAPHHGAIPEYTDEVREHMGFLP